EADLPSDAFDWLSGSSSAPTPSGAGIQPEEQITPEASAESPASAFLPDQGQNLDSIFSMEMPDWLSGFTPSEPTAATPAAPTSDQLPAALSGDNLSPADLPSWVQAMRPIESVVGGTQGGVDDQFVEQEGPLAGMRSVLPVQANLLGVSK